MNIFYKLGILLAMLINSLLGTAQTKAEKIYDMYSLKDGITLISFSKSIVKPFDLFIDSETKKLLMDMDKVAFLVYNQSKGDVSSDALHKRLVKDLSGGQYFEIDPKELDWVIESNGTCNNPEDFKMIGHGKKNQMSEFHVVMKDNQHAVLFSFFGNITIEDLKCFDEFTHTTKTTIIR
jgi:hypothetical protein